MKKYDKEWLYDKLAMQKQFRALMDKRTTIRDIKTEEAEAISYSTNEPAIYIKKDSKFTKGMTPRRARAFRYGLFTRELLKLRFTNYDYRNRKAEELKPYEIPIFKVICDVVESAVVGVLAPSFIGGYLLKSYKDACIDIYKNIEDINNASTPFQEFLLAFEQVAEIGTLKGTFKTPAAQTIFYKCHTLILEVLEEMDSEKRVDTCLEILEKSKPLWEADAKEAYEVSATLSEGLLSMFGIAAFLLGGYMTSGSGSGTILDPEDIEDFADFSKGGYRDTAYHDISELSEEDQIEYKRRKEEQEKMRKDYMLSISHEEEEEPLSTFHSSSSGSGYDKDDVYIDRTNAGDLRTISDYDPMEYEMNVEADDFFDKLMEVELEQERRIEASASTTALVKPLDLPEIHEKYTLREYPCINRIVNLGNWEEAADGYNKVVSEYEGLIVKAVNEMKSIFEGDVEEPEYKTSGKLSIKRMMASTVTPKMFTKKIEPKNKSNMSVFICVDESWSMNGARILRAKMAAICLGEVFRRLGIPLYVMGFTADTNGSNQNVDHTHYVMWSTTMEDLMKLTAIKAKDNNFDGYSIRYASKVLDKRSEEYKVMIVISDGQPICSAYVKDDDGLRDTKDAISEARKNSQQVLGVAIGADLIALHEMYGEDFVYVNETEDLFTGISNRFARMVREW